MELQIDKLGKVAITVEEDYWSPNKDYDKLTIVEKQGAFGTYISRKPVPAGADLNEREYWIPFSKLKEEIVLQFNDLINELDNLSLTVEQKEAEIYQAMVALTAGGLVLAQSEGQSQVIGMSQKAITDRLNEIESLVHQFNPSYFGVTLIARPNIIYEDRLSAIDLTAKINNDNIADEIEIKIGNTTLTTEEDTYEISAHTTINDTTEFKAIAKQGRFTYESTVTVIATNPYYIGSGMSYSSVVGASYEQSIRESPAGTYNVTVENNGEYIFFVIPQHMNINKAFIGGNRINITTPTTTNIDDKPYKYLRTQDTFNAGQVTITLS